MIYSFRDCVVGGTNVVDEWLSRQPDAVRARFASNFKHLAATPKALWGLPHTQMLHGEFRELREFRAKILKVHYRLGGFHGAGNQIVLCSGWKHSQNKAAEKAAMKRALELKERVEKGQVTTVGHV